MKIAMVLRRSYAELLSDIRVKKEATALAEYGYVVHIYVYGCGVAEHYLNERIKVIQIDSKTKLINKYNFYSDKVINKNNLLVRVFKKIIDKIMDKRFINTIKQKDYNVVHCHDLDTLRIGFFLKKTTEIKFIYDSHEVHSEYLTSEGISSSVRRCMTVFKEGFFIKNVDYVICVNQYCKGVIEKLYKKNKIILLDNVSEKNYNPIKNSLREKIGVKDDTRLIIYQGLISKNKGILELLKISELLNDGIAIVVAGKGECVSEVINKRSNGRVFYLGMLTHDDLYDYIKQCDIGVCLIKNVCNSYFYSSPNKMWDYLVCGVPCISSDFPYMREVINEYNAGILVDPDDWRGLANTINWLFSEDGLKELTNLKVNAEYAGTLYNWQIEKKNLINLYSEIKDEYLKNENSLYKSR